MNDQPAHRIVESEMLSAAYDLAARSHATQVRWTASGDEPYLNHPFRVFAILLELGVTDDATLAAALLHDTVEDAPAQVWEDYAREVTPGEAVDPYRVLSVLFGETVARTVHGLTNVPGVRYIEHVAAATADPRVLAVKSGDYLDNGGSLDPRHPRYERLMKKYAPLAAVLADRLRDSQAAQALIPRHPDLLARLEGR